MSVREGPRLGRETETVTGGSARRGERSALRLFVGCTVVHLFVAFWVVRTGGTQNDFSTLEVDAVLLLFAPAIAAVMAMNLPRAAKQPFWLTFAVCAVASGVLWATTFVAFALNLIPGTK